MKFAFVDAEKAQFPVIVLCEVMEVSRAGYYAWREREKSPRELENETLVVAIKAIHKRSRSTYGSPRVHIELKKQGWEVGLNRVSRLMQENGICVKPRRGYRCTTQADPSHPVVANELDRDFSATAFNEKWVTDVTNVPTDEGWLYLATMLDLYNREIVGWAMDDHNDQNLTLSALNMALETYEPPQGLLHHSDRGSTYTAGDYRDALKDYGIVCSMSRKGNCWDNAVAESFFATIKKELIHRTKFKTRREAAAAIFEYIEFFYNRIRLHSTLGYTTPAEYRSNNTTVVKSA